MKAGKLVGVICILCLMGSLSAQVGINNQGACIYLSEGSLITIPGNYSQLDSGEIEIDGSLKLYGDWINDQNDSLQHRAARASTGKIYFVGMEEQQIRGSHISVFPKLILDNPDGLKLLQTLEIKDTLEWVKGKILAREHELFLSNPSPYALQMMDSTYYVVGGMARNVNLGRYPFPIGTQAYLQKGTFILTDSIHPQKVSLYFHPQAQTPPQSLEVDGGRIISILDAGYWSLNSDNPSIPAPFTLRLSSQGHSNGGNLATQHGVLFRGNAAWSTVGIRDTANITGQGLEPITATQSGLNQWGDFAIGVGEYPLSVPNPYSSFFSAFRQGHGQLKVVLKPLKPQRVQISLFSISGQLLDRVSDFGHTGTNEWIFDLDTWPDQAFIVYLIGEKEAFSAKIWK